MADKNKTKAQLINELHQLRQDVGHLKTEAKKNNQTQKTLGKENGLAQMYLDVAGVMFVAIDKNHQVTLINQKGCEILGYPEEEIIGKNWSKNFIPAEYQAKTMSTFQLIMQGKTQAVEYYENPVLTKNGITRLIAWHNTVIKDENNQPIATLSSGQDITEQARAQKELLKYKNHLEELVDKRTAQLKSSNEQLHQKIEQHKNTEEALIESQIRFAGILDIANEAIISIDEDQKIVLFNKGAEKIFGYTATEAVGRPLEILLPKKYVLDHSKHIKEFATASEAARLMGKRNSIFGRKKNGHVFPAAASISKLEVGSQKILTVVLRDITKEKEIAHERELRITGLNALNEATRAITAELSLEQVLHKITQAAKELMQANFAALGMHDGHGHLSRFIAIGVDPEQREKIGPLPVGRGLLGVLLHQGESLIVDNIADHPMAAGFPENHPPMNNLLGVPIYSKGDLIGALYLADKEDGTQFTTADQKLVEMLALHAAIAIENARLYGQTQRLAILEERERFARDLHDGIIQSIYAVGLALDQAKMDIRPTNYDARQQIELSLKSLASVIQDIRNYIFDLRPEALKYQGLRTRLEGLVKELRVNTLLPIQAEITPGIDKHLTEMQSRHIFHITHEALSNAARHAKASRISLVLTKDDSFITTIVEDDGIGFKVSPNIAPGHHGISNMQARADQLNATLDINSVPQQGTRLTLTLQLGASAE